jgi:hypothetical protein
MVPPTESSDSDGQLSIEILMPAPHNSQTGTHNKPLTASPGSPAQHIAMNMCAVWRMYSFLVSWLPTLPYVVS